jgi:glyoxalase family protein
VNFAIATDGPGFSIEVPNQVGGELLSLPPWLEPRRTMIERRLRHKDPAPANAPGAPKKPF